MKNPNGFGSVVRLSGKRRKPWAVRITDGYEIKNGKLICKRKYIGYYETRKEALTALSKYNVDPYFIPEDITFSELYEKWSAEKYPSLSTSGVHSYQAAYAVCKPIYETQFADLKRINLQAVIDNSNKGYATLRNVKILFSQLFEYAIQNDIVQKDYSQFVDVAKHKDKNKETMHKAFSADEIGKLWELSPDTRIQVILMMIYSGVRISELLDLKKCDIHINERYFNVVSSKTEAGVRAVPIADKVFPFFDTMMTADSEHLVTLDGKKVGYQKFIQKIWLPSLELLGASHKPHDTRHTCVSMLANANVNPTIIKKIIGHSGAMNLTEKVYTHFEIAPLLNAINKI